ncbi:MAG: hypothetical protein J3K34DRAFT_520722 [Monoraphidium minutum]|nr:MAG: hypothetical protein J3K34DRAFT_520722 [Monoraphidium minutum]
MSVLLLLVVGSGSDAYYEYPAQPDDACTEANFGKCDEPFMADGNYCATTCNRTACQDTPDRVVAVAAVPELCTDEKPPGSDLTCAEQAEFGQCEAPWMLAGGFCAETCGRWPCVTAAPPASDHGVPPGCTDASFGACDADWMVRTSACARTCGRPPCPAIVTAEVARAAQNATAAAAEALRDASFGNATRDDDDEETPGAAAAANATRTPASPRPVAVVLPARGANITRGGNAGRAANATRARGAPAAAVGNAVRATNATRAAATIVNATSPRPVAVGVAERPVEGDGSPVAAAVSSPLAAPPVPTAPVPKP